MDMLGGGVTLTAQGCIFLKNRINSALIAASVVPKGKAILAGFEYFQPGG